MAQPLDLLRRLWRRGDAASDLTDELEHHRALVQADLEARGIAADRAALESRRVMGNMTLAREDARDLRVVRWADRLARDVRVAARRLGREKTFTLTAALTLALGITTTTTVFSVADAELWKPLPYPHPDELVAVFSRGPADTAATDGISGADLLEWRARVRTLSAITMPGRTLRQVLQGATAESVLVSEVAANYFATLGRPAILGRTFTDADAHGARAAVLTDRAWRRLFAADASIVGRSIVLDGAALVVAGVTAADDSLGHADPDVFVALDESSPAFLNGAQPLGYGLVARLRPGVRPEEAAAEWQAQMASRPGRAGHRVFVQDLREYFTGYNWRPLYFFLGASLLVLLLSAVNVASLFLSRAAGRVREFALRSALGGGQAALARQLSVEGALVALPAGALGVLLAAWAVQIFTAALPADFLERGRDIPIDLRVGAFAFAATLLSTVLFALAPLPLARRLDAAASLRSGTRSGRSRAEGRARGLLIVGQLALTLILISGAGIFLKSFLALRRVPLGFQPDNLISLRVSLSGPRYESDSAVRAYADRLLERTRGIAGTREAVIASSSPLASGPLAFFARADRPRPAAGAETRAILRNATPGYFRTLGIRVVRGREFSSEDVPGAPTVAVINETMASRTFGTEDPIGRVIELLPGGRMPWTRRPGPLRVVGVAANAKQVELNELDFSDVYVPFAQMPAPRLELIVRTAVPAARVTDPVRELAAQVDPSVPVTGTSTFEARVADALRGDRFNMALVCWFAGVAIVLASIAIYGAVAQQIESRTSEFGVRMALGARPIGLVAVALRRTARLAVIGAAAGLAGVFALAALIGSALYIVPGSHDGLLYGVTTTDPAILACAFGGLVLVAIAAGAVPARRVTRMDPVRALRSE